MDKIKNNVSNFLRWYMEIGKLTQAEMADLIGIKQGQLSAYLMMKQLPSLNLAQKIAIATHFPIDYIIGFGEFPQGTPRPEDINVVREVLVNYGKVNNMNFAQGDININTSVKRTHIYNSKPDDLSSDQASALKQLVDEIVELEMKTKLKPKSHGAVWAALNRKMKTTYYREIKSANYSSAVAFLRQWRGRLKSTKTFKKEDASIWRKDRYKAIKTIAKIELQMSDVQLKFYIKDTFDKTSLTELTDEELETLYRRFIKRKNDK